MDLENKETRLRYLNFLFYLSIFFFGLSLCWYFSILLGLFMSYLFEVVVLKVGGFSFAMIFWGGVWIVYKIARSYFRISELGRSRRQVKQKQLKQISICKRIILLSVGQCVWSFLWLMGDKVYWQ